MFVNISLKLNFQTFLPLCRNFCYAYFLEVFDLFAVFEARLTTISDADPRVKHPDPEHYAAYRG